MAPKKEQLATELRALETKHGELVEAVKALATHATVLAVAVRDLSVREPGSVPSADLDAALAGLNELSAGLPLK